MTDLTMPPTPLGRLSPPVHNRYVLPSFVERTSYGVKESNPYNKMFEDRIIFLGVQVDDASANDVMAQLITLEGMDPDRDITMYINSPGGSYTAMTAIYDTMQYVRPDISTVCLGQAASAAALLLAGGTTGKRLAPPDSPILIPHAALPGGQGARRAEPAHPDPPAGAPGRPGPGQRSGDPGARDPADADPDGGVAGAAHRSPAGAGHPGHRPGQDHDRTGGQGVRRGRRGSGQPQGEPPAGRCCRLTATLPPAADRPGASAEHDRAGGQAGTQHLPDPVAVITVQGGQIGRCRALAAE